MKETRSSMDGKDRISELPDGLIHQILSRIDMPQVVKTCILSKRWRYIWTSVNTVSIDFNSPEFENYPVRERIARFIDFVDKVLNLRDVDADVNKFCLTFSLSEENDENIKGPDCFNMLTSRLNAWISTVVRRNIKYLYINIDIGAEMTFELPECLFNCKTLVKLSLEMGFKDYSLIVVPKSFCLPRLRYLTLEGLSFRNPGAATRLISSCPVLEDLLIADSGIQMGNHEDLFIDSSTLADFTLINGGWQDCLTAKTIKLNAPNLKSFFCSDFITQEYSLNNLSSLVDADIAILMRGTGNNEQYPRLYLELSEEDKQKYGKHLLSLLGALRNVKELTLYEGILQVASGSLDSGIQLPHFCNLRCLKLDFWLTRGCLRSMSYLLTVSPNVESFQLCLNSFTDEDDDKYVGGSPRSSILLKVGDDWKAGLPLPCTLLHLKHASIVGIEGEDIELEFLEFLLKNAVVLEELSLDSDIEDVSPVRKRQMNKYWEKLITLPKASSSLRINFEIVWPTSEGRQILTWPTS